MLRTINFILVAFFLASSTSGQTTDVFLPSDTPASGSSVSQPFGMILTPGVVAGHTMVQQIPAYALSGSGLNAGDVITDVALTPWGGGTINVGSFQAYLGFTTTPWDTTQLLGNIFGAETIYDSTVQGAFSWPVTAHTWNTLNPTPLNLVWDGYSDLALYFSTGSVSVIPNPPTGGSGITAIWLGNFHSGGGLYPRNFALGYQASLPTSSDNKGLRTRLTVTLAGSGSIGTVTFLPSNQVNVGGFLTCVFSAPGHGGEMYIPFVACNNVPSVIWGNNLPMTYDACSDFYFNHPFGTSVFNLASGGHFATLGTGGVATGIVFAAPSIFPPGLNLGIGVTFATTDGVSTMIHGDGFFTVN